VKETSAEDIANYTIDTAALVAGQDTATLQSDKKSVVIKLGASGVITGGLLTNNTAYEFAVNKNLEATDGKTLGTTQSKTVLFVDKAAPVLSSITTEENRDVTISFNERLDEATAPSIVLNEKAVDPASVTVNSDGTVTIVAADAAVAALESGKAYTAVVSGAKDLIGNTMSLVTKSFTYTVKNAEPTLLTATADGETNIELKFDEALSTNLVNNTTVKVFKGATQIAAVPASADNKTIDLGLTYSDVYGANETSANLTVVIEGYKDVQGNLGQKVTRSVTLNKDVVKPTVTKTEYDAATGLVTLTLSEALAGALEADYAPELFVTDKNGVKYNVVALGTAATELLTTGDVTAGDKTITFDASEFANGTYTLTIMAGAFEDEANTANGIATTSVSFTKGSASDADTPTFDSAVEVTKGQFTVTFSEAVKGGAVTGSATALSSYKLNGSDLPAGTTIYLNEAQTVATITLPANSIAASGVKLLTVNGVQDLSGKAVAETTRTVSLTENTKPSLTSAKVVNGELELTFSENVNNAVGLDFSDFEVTVNGVAVTEAAGVASPAANNKFVISVSDANLATGTIVVKVSDTANATDFAGNVIVTGTTVSATR
jgi:Bacterial Ig-like domain